MTSVDPDLVKQLRIASDDRESLGGARAVGHGGAQTGWVLGAVGATLAVVAAVAAGWWWFAGRAVTVRTVAAVSAGAAAASPTAGAVLQATGYVTARRRATVSTQITGTLTQVLIEEGDHVAAGQVLARLEDGSVRAALNAARANQAAAQAQVAQAGVQLAQAQSDARRSDELVQSGMTTRQLAEQARANVGSLQAVLAARQREAEAAQAQVAQAQVTFDYTVVRAPFAGVITEKAAQVGEIVSPLSAGGGFTRTGVGTIVDMDSLEVDVDVNEASIAQLHPDMPAEAVIDAYPDWRIPAHVIAVVPAADRGKATVKVRVALEQKDARLVPDIGVRVTFLQARPAAAATASAATPAQAPAPKGVVVPATTLATRDGHPVVFVVADGHAAQRTVQPLPQPGGTSVQLPVGVQPGDMLVVSPGDALHDGAAVRVEEASAK